MDLRMLNTVWKFDFQYCLEISDADVLLQNYFSEGSIVLRRQFYWIHSNCCFFLEIVSWKRLRSLFNTFLGEQIQLMFKREIRIVDLKFQITLMFRGYFIENHLIKIHKIDHKTSGWSLCQDYLGVFSLWYQKLQGL